MKIFRQGYVNDAGIDLICEKKYVFEPMTTTIVQMEHKCTPLPGTCGMLVARTSAAKKGLIISMCPIDADYTGNLTAIVFNTSKHKIIYEKGQAFAQIVFIKLAIPPLHNDEVEQLHEYYEKRGNNKLGSTEC